jgi:fatty-acyl-CoA synthase
MLTTLLLEIAAESSSDRIALGSHRGGLTYADMLGRARTAAAWLASEPVDTLVYVGLNSLAFPLALYAAGVAGKPLAPLNYRLHDADLRAILARTAPSLAIVEEDAIPRVTGIEGVRIVSSREFLAKTTADALRAAPKDPPDGESVAVLLFTSGTTGKPKAAVLRHRHLTSYVLSTLEFMGADETESALVSVPAYHIAGVAAILSCTYLGRRIVQLESFSPENWVRLVRDEQVTHAMVVPTMLGRVLDVLEKEGEHLTSLRHLSYGGGRMPEPTIRRALNLLPHVDFVNAYGLTETSSTIAVLSSEDHRVALASNDARIGARLGSVGRPLPTIELEIRGADGRALPAGESGEIFVRGEQVSGEYLSHRAILDDGWLPTKDCGWIDEGGFLFVEGRLDDVIVRGGENISPGEIEDVLRTHAEVIDVAVVGFPDEEWGERVVAVVVSKTTPPAEELRQWVRQRLRSSRTPDEIIFRSTLPYNETGKLLRRSLRMDLSRAEKLPAAT